MNSQQTNIGLKRLKPQGPPAFDEQRDLLEQKCLKRQKVAETCVSSQTTICTPISQEVSSQNQSGAKRLELVNEMFQHLVEEFNCNHQQDAETDQQTIFNRHVEEQQIRNFLTENIKRSRSGLMYLCGHPGTGKTSLLNQVLSSLRKSEEQPFELFMYNAMPYNDVKSFAITLEADMKEKFTGKETYRRSRNTVDDDLISSLLAKLLAQTKTHKILVIDEVDHFNTNEKSFTTLVKTLLTQTKSLNTNCSIVGIANAVDLPFRKKHSAIAMRDCQLLFKPYDYEQLVDILETKKNMLFHRLPAKFTSNEQMKKTFHSLIDHRVYEFIAKKVSIQNGDIRCAFDLMKTVLNAYGSDIKSMPESSEFRLTVNHILHIYEKKQSSKVKEVLRHMPRQNITLLQAALVLFEDQGSEQGVKLQALFEETEMECDVREQPKIKMPLFMALLSELEQYKLLKQDKSSKGTTIVQLNCDLHELQQALQPAADEQP